MQQGYTTSHLWMATMILTGYAYQNKRSQILHKTLSLRKTGIYASWTRNREISMTASLWVSNTTLFLRWDSYDMFGWF